MEADSPLLICCSANNDPSWRWFAPDLPMDLRWEFCNVRPRNAFERLVRRPNVAMIRACLDAVRTAKRRRADLLVTHDPRVTFWCGVFCRIIGVQVRHLAWSFNFPKLPRGLKRRWMARAFTDVDRFIVYSTMEKALYRQHFGIPAGKIDVVPWGVEPPIVSGPPLIPGDCICAIGGNARDYRTLLAAMRELPGIPLALVVRPRNLRGLAIPPNVTPHVNVPLDHAMNILGHSRFMVLPLTGSEVPCGHVTLVAAMHLGKAFIITNSSGVSDYVIDGVNAISCEAFSAPALRDAIRELWENPSLCERLGENGRRFASEHCTPAALLAHFAQYLEENGLLAVQAPLTPR